MPTARLRRRWPPAIRAGCPSGADPFPFLTEPRNALSSRPRSCCRRYGRRSRNGTRCGLPAAAGGAQAGRARGTGAAGAQPRDFVGQFSLRALASAADPYPAFAHLHRLGSLHFAPSEGGWLVLSVDLVNAVLHEPTVFSSTINSDFDTELIGPTRPLHTLNRAAAAIFLRPKSRPRSGASLKAWWPSWRRRCRAGHPSTL